MIRYTTTELRLTIEELKDIAGVEIIPIISQTSSTGPDQVVELVVNNKSINPQDLPLFIDKSHGLVGRVKFSVDTVREDRGCGLSYYPYVEWVSFTEETMSNSN